MPSAKNKALGKEGFEFFLKKIPLCRVPSQGHSAKTFRKKKSLPSAVLGALGKVFSKKNLCRVPDLGHSAKTFLKKNLLCQVLGQVTLGKEAVKQIKKPFAECQIGGTRQSIFQKKSLPSARSGTLAKNFFLKKTFFVEC